MHDFATNNPVRHVGALVGHTPLLGIHFRYKGDERRVFAKYEVLNLTGSIKDRMALHILGRAYATGALRPGMEIVEATSGNTGISLAAIGRALGHQVRIFMPDWMSRERKQIICGFGGQLEEVTKEEGGFLGSIAMAEALAAENPEVFLPRQFSNDDNALAHEHGTGPEIMRQLASTGQRVDAFVAGVGTGGTVMGVGRCMKALRPEIQVHALEPSNSPTLSTGCKVGKHRIQGISDEFIPDVVKLQELDRVVSVDDGDAIIMAQMLASTTGLGVGISSGANLIGAIQIQDELGPEAVVVTVLPDSNKKYLSTDLLNNEPVKPGFISPDVELLYYDSIPPIPRM